MKKVIVLFIFCFFIISAIGGCSDAGENKMDDIEISSFMLVEESTGVVLTESSFDTVLDDGVETELITEPIVEEYIDVDYPEVEEFEAALNAGEVLIDKIVVFEVTDFKPNSAYGYDLWAGEHLNFVSVEHPRVGIGDTVTAKIIDVYSVMGSWIINYEIISFEENSSNDSDDMSSDENLNIFEHNSVDFPEIEKFETALNEGEVLIDKIVVFEVTDFTPNSAFGYDLWAGEHLNFVSAEHPGVGIGDVVTARVIDVYSVLGSWIIDYELIDVETDN